MKYITRKMLDFLCSQLNMNHLISSLALLLHASKQYMGLWKPAVLTFNLIPIEQKNTGVIFWQFFYITILCIFLHTISCIYILINFFSCFQWQITLLPQTKCTLLHIIKVGRFPKSKSSFTNGLWKPSNNFCFSLNYLHHFC